MLLTIIFIKTIPPSLSFVLSITPSPDTLRFSSAGKSKDQKSKQGNRELHSILYFLAIQQVQVAKVSGKPRNPVLQDYYQRKINEGKTKKQALVCVMRRLVNIVYGMMKYRTAYAIPELPEKEAV